MGGKRKEASNESRGTGLEVALKVFVILTPAFLAGVLDVVRWGGDSGEACRQQAPQPRVTGGEGWQQGQHPRTDG